jgi:hypothetical protein
MYPSKRGRFNVLFALLATGGLAACADQPQVTEETERQVREEGVTATKALMGMLQANLMAAMKEGGPAHAVEFCAGEALALTDSVAGQLGPGISLKRVSSRHRNPVNAPDAAETKALRYFEEAREETGTLPEDWVQQTPSGELRYYRPVVMAEPCLACHGDPESLNPAVAEAIRERYPDDRATGYEVGDLRGLIRVSVSRERVGEAADGQG